MVSEKIKQIRRECVESTLEDIINVPAYSSFHSHAYCKLMHLGLLLKAEEECLFDKEEWSNPEKRDDLIKKIESFLTRHIR